jgi:hypothetical protein
MKYYRLFDPETPRVMASGYNETDLDDIRECIICWAKPTKSEMKLFSTMDAKELAKHFDIEIQESDSEFPEDEDPVNLITK